MLINRLDHPDLFALYLQETGTNTFPEFEVMDFQMEDTESAWQPLQFEVVERCKRSSNTTSHHLSILDLMSWTVTRVVPAQSISVLQDSLIIECDSDQTRQDVANLISDVVGVQVATKDGEEVGGSDNYGYNLRSTSVSPRHTKVKGDN